MSAEWKKVGENLVRHVGSGTIYLRGRVAGKSVRVSLGTDNLKIAKIVRDTKLETLRDAAKAAETGQAGTIGAALDMVETRTLQPHLKASSRKFYGDIVRLLRKSLPVTTKASDFTAEQASEWWVAFTAGKSPQRANQCLSIARRIGAIIVEHGYSRDNPFGKIRRLALPQSNKAIPAMPDIDRVIQSIRDQKLRYSNETANFVAFLAYSGLRIAEARAVVWGDVGTDWLNVTGGKLLTKNRKQRKVPISAPLRTLLDGMKALHSETVPPSLPLFRIVSPRSGLQNAAKRLGIPHIHPHLLRHHFATWAIESGVDIPTVAKWLGHLDGGVLAMKTYGHLRDEHSLRMIGLLNQSGKSEV